MNCFLFLLVLFQDQGQCSANRLLPDLLPAAVKVVFPGESGIFVGIADEDRAHGVSEFIAGGAGQARDSHRRMGANDPSGTLRHGLGHRGGYSAMGVQNFHRNAENFVLNLVAIADNAPRKHSGSAAYLIAPAVVSLLNNKLFSKL